MEIGKVVDRWSDATRCFSSCLLPDRNAESWFSRRCFPGFQASRAGRRRKGEKRVSPRLERRLASRFTRRLFPLDWRSTRRIRERGSGSFLARTLLALLLARTTRKSFGQRDRRDTFRGCELFEEIVAPTNCTSSKIRLSATFLFTRAREIAQTALFADSRRRDQIYRGKIAPIRGVLEERASKSKIIANTQCFLSEYTTTRDTVQLSLRGNRESLSRLLGTKSRDLLDGNEISRL